ncbi:MAG TPA: ankyrin repeat domain-containing protein [Steroidobacteraceae bacterium]
MANTRRDRNAPAGAIAICIGATVLAIAGCGKPSDPKAYQSLIPAVLNNDLGEIRRLVAEEHYDVNKRTSGTGETALQSAATAGQTNIVVFLLDHGADPNRGDAGNMTPLHGASYGNHPEAARLLLRAGAHVDEVLSKIKTTPLMVAASKGHREVVDILLTAGANVSLRDLGGETAEEKARRFGHRDVAADLEAARVEMNRKQGP